MSASCHEEGIVTGVAPGGFVKVTVERGEACGSCEARGACQTLGGPKKDLVLVMENRVEAEEGDTVRLTMNESSVVQASAVLYLLPAVCLMAGAATGYFVAEKIGLENDPGAAIGSLIGLIVGFVFSWLISKRFARKKSFMPRLTAITSRRPEKDTVLKSADPEA